MSMSGAATAISDVPWAPRYGYLTLLPVGADDVVSVVEFLKLYDDGYMLYGVAPEGSLLSAYPAEDLALAEDSEAEDDGRFVACVYVALDHSMVADFGAFMPADVAVWPFDGDGGRWPDVTAALTLVPGAFVPGDDGEPYGSGDEAAEAAGGELALPAAAAVPEAKTKAKAKGKAPREKALSATAKTAATLESIQEVLSSMAAGQVELTRRVAGLEMAKAEGLPHAGRGGPMPGAPSLLPGWPPAGPPPPSLAGLAGPAPFRLDFPAVVPTVAQKAAAKKATVRGTGILLGPELPPAGRGQPLLPPPAHAQAPPAVRRPPGLPPPLPASAAAPKTAPQVNPAAFAHASTRFGAGAAESPADEPLQQPLPPDPASLIQQRTLETMHKMAEAMIATAGSKNKGSGWTGGAWDPEEEGDLAMSRIPGCKGALAMDSFRRSLAAHPTAITAAVRANRRGALTGPATADGTADCTRNYLTKEVPFGAAKTAAYFMYGIAEAFDLLEAGKWEAAEAQLALLLVAGEHAAVRDWRWSHAWLLTHLPEPPWTNIARPPPRDSVRPFARLAAPSWIAAVVAYAKDVSTLAEAEKRPLTKPGAEEGYPKKAGQPKKPQRKAPPAGAD